jgi:hypothetical protein
VLVEARIVVAAVLVAAADAVRFTRHLPNFMPILLPHGMLKK